VGTVGRSKPDVLDEGRHFKDIAVGDDFVQPRVGNFDIPDWNFKARLSSSDMLHIHHHEPSSAGGL
jgi:hypothetical protein